MVLYIINKEGGLDTALKAGRKIAGHHFQDAAMQLGENFVSTGEYSTSFTDKCFRLNDYFVLSKDAVQFLALAAQLGLCKEVQLYEHKWFMFEITAESLQLSSYMGVFFGESEASLKLGLPAVSGEWRDVLPREQVETCEYGNRFNGGVTYHPTKKFEEIKITDAVGNPYKIAHVANQVSGGYGIGYKGGFKNLPA